MRAREGRPRECSTQTHVLARESEKMAVKKLVRRVCTGAAATVLMIPLAQAAQLAVNDEVPLTIVSPGFFYTTTQSSQVGNLSVTMDGYLFCANVILEEQDVSAVTMTPGHARWSLPSAVVKSVAYSGGKLEINRSGNGSEPTTLVCHARGPLGQIATPFSRWGRGVFGNGFDSLEANQYESLVNWMPVAGFDWNQPDWTQVPTDSCQFDMTPENSPAVEEGTLCAAAAGVRPGQTAFGTRAPTMWTATHGSNFIYLARIDARLGAQSIDGSNSQFESPLSISDVEDVPSSINFKVRDGFDSQYLSPTGTYCFLSSLPATLTSSVCTGAPAGGPVDGTFDYSIALSVLTTPTLSRYVAVIRSTTTNFPPIHTPIAAISIMSEPTTAREEQGDAFVGDNVIFGFPGGGGFPWMTQ